MPDVYAELIYTPAFERQAKALLMEEDLRALESHLAVRPRKGAVIPETG